MVSNRVNIYEFIEKLISATQKDLCQWVDNNNDTYRLVLKSGSVVLRIIYDHISDYTRYEIKLYDDADCFAVYMAESFDQLYGMLESLFKTIKEAEKIGIEKKIFNLYSDLMAI